MYNSLSLSLSPPTDSHKINITIEKKEEERKERKQIEMKKDHPSRQVVTAIILHEQFVRNRLPKSRLMNHSQLAWRLVAFQKR